MCLLEMAAVCGCVVVFIFLMIAVLFPPAVFPPSPYVLFILFVTRIVMKIFQEFMHEQIAALAGNGQFGTAHVYKSTLKSVNEFWGRDLGFDDISPEFVKSYETWLRIRNRSWNTVSTYIRAIRSVYNRAIAEGVAVYKPLLFRRVFTGTKVNVKRSLDRKSMSRFLSRAGSVRLVRELAWVGKMAKLMFMLRGIPFVDMVYLQKSDLCGNVLTYRRRKTGRMMSVVVTGDAMKLLRSLADRDKTSPYLFPILDRNSDAESSYNQYRRALRKFNRCLEALGRSFGVQQRISSYTMRHTWGTVAYHCEIHSGIISEAMGHSSIKVTETYLKPFDTNRLDEANRLVIKAVEGVGKRAMV